MKYKGKLLILDNFRSVLSEYEVDVQDVVRSAILDGLDVLDYIEVCRENAYKLDQIRLSMKEDIPDVLFNSMSGEQLYIIRKLKSKNYNIEPIITQVKVGRLSGCYLDFLISWVTKGIDITGLKISTIPKKMLEIFDMHLCQGRDMRPFNNGKIYSKEYILYCMSIQEKGRDITRFANEDWPLDVLSYLSSIVGNVSEGVWNSVMSVVTRNTELARVKLMFNAANLKLPVDQLGRSTYGHDLYDDESIEVIIEAAKGKFDYKSLMAGGLTAEERLAKLDEMKMNRGKKVGGILRRS